MRVRISAGRGRGGGGGERPEMEWGIKRRVGKGKRRENRRVLLRSSCIKVRYPRMAPQEGEEGEEGGRVKEETRNMGGIQTISPL